MITIALVGLPSVGKSTLINSLVGKRILQTGSCRTTTESVFIGKDNPLSFTNFKEYDLVSDDGYPFSIIDLPGIETNGVIDIDPDDIDEYYLEEVSNSYKIALMADIILWVSKGDCAFMDKVERIEFKKLNRIVREKMLENNKPYQIGLVLTKMDEDCETILVHHSNEEISGDEDEIIGDEKEFSVRDTLDRISKFDLTKNIPVIHFNSFGRIIFTDSSDALKGIVRKKQPSTTNNNIRFDLEPFKSNLPNVMDRLNRQNFHKYYMFLCKEYHGTKNYPKTKTIDDSNYAFDLDKLLTQNDISGFEKFMRVMYLLPDSQDSYREFMKHNFDSDEISFLENPKIGVKLANLHVCSKFKERIQSLVERCATGIYKYSNFLNIDDYATYVDSNKYACTVMKITEGRTLRYIHLVSTFVALRADGTSTLMKYYTHEGSRKSLNLMTESITEYDQKINDNEMAILDLNFQETVRDVRQKIYPGERIDMSQLMTMKRNGTVDTVLENVLYCTNGVLTVIDTTKTSVSDQFIPIGTNDNDTQSIKTDDDETEGSENDSSDTCISYMRDVEINERTDTTHSQTDHTDQTENVINLRPVGFYQRDGIIGKTPNDTSKVNDIDIESKLNNLLSSLSN